MYGSVVFYWGATANNDTITGDNSANTLDGGAGDDILTGTTNDDFLTGGSGIDTIVGNGGFNTLIETANIEKGNARFVLNDDDLEAGDGIVEIGFAGDWPIAVGAINGRFCRLYLLEWKNENE